MRTFHALMIALALPLAAATTSWAQCDCGAAGGNGCGAEAGCGCAADPGCGGCGKVCKLVRVEKEIKAVCYGVKCKDICIPGCGSECTTTHCITCGKAGCCDCCSSGASCTVRIPTGKPGCVTKMKTVKHLTKYVTTKKVCTYEWRVVKADCCSDPGCGCEGNGNGCDAGHGCDAGNGCAANGSDCGCAG